MSITLIAAMDRKRAIGRSNKLPWHLPADMAFFVSQTKGKAIIMGRKTFQSFGEKPLKNRRNIVLTRDLNYKPEGAETANSIEQFLSSWDNNEELMVIGGQQIYEELLPAADFVLLTEIDEEFEGTDAFFPKLDEQQWKLVNSVAGTQDEKNSYNYKFQTYQRIR